MSDFFSRLAQRTLGLAPTLQPRMASMFAQTTQLADTELFESIADASTPPDSINTPGQPVQPRSIVPSQPGQQPLVQAASALTFTPTGNASGAHMDDLASSTPQSQVSERAAITSAQVTSSSATFTNYVHEQTIRTEKAITREILQPVQENKQSSDPLPLSSISLSDAKALAPTFPDIHTSIKIQHVHPLTKVGHTTTLPGPEKIVNQANPSFTSPALPYTPALQPPSQATSRTKVNALPTVTTRATIQHISEQRTENRDDTSPSIHVTIGRIEVRATSPAPAPTAQPPQKSEPAVKSLDDYLQQRAKGGH